MEFRNWIDIKEKLHRKLEEIFNNQNINELSKYEKRKIVFDFLVNTLKYDFDLLEDIKKGNTKRDLVSELNSVIDNNIGICNAISQYYKLLLEELDIRAHAIICDDGTDVNHQLNIVYDEDNDIYSFDDITSVIVGRGSSNTFFDYDLEIANKQGQGNKEVLNDDKWVVLPEEYTDFLVNRSKSKYEDLNGLPSNISSVKQKSEYHY
ncbi:MAG: hypothetical protein IKE10_03395 [Bacilli bacterium]|nr:hypothetical protein [Bacilli bacterium]